MQTLNRALMFAIPTLIGAVVTLGAQQPSAAPAAAVDPSRLGPQVGERVPDFALPDQTGQVRSLQSILGPKGTMLVFYRSADW